MFCFDCSQCERSFKSQRALSCHKHYCKGTKKRPCTRRLSTHVPVDDTSSTLDYDKTFGLDVGTSFPVNEIIEELKVDSETPTSPIRVHTRDDYTFENYPHQYKSYTPDVPGQPTPTDPFPFKSTLEFQLINFMQTNQVSQRESNKLWKIVNNTGRFTDQIDIANHDIARKKLLSLLDGPTWKKISFVFNRPEEGVWNGSYDMYVKDIIQCALKLYMRKDLSKDMIYTSYRAQSQASGERVFDEAQSGNRWAQMENEIQSNATLAPLALAADETPLTLFTKDKSAFPVYLTTLTIEKKTRKALSRHAWDLCCLGPKIRMNSSAEPKMAALIRCDFVHTWLSILLEPLDHDKRGIAVRCGDDKIRLLSFRLFCIICDLKEAHSFTCLYKQNCNFCIAAGDDLQDLNKRFKSRDDDEDKIQALISRAGLGDDSARKELHEQKIHCVESALYKRTRIFRCISLDLLHQLYKGCFVHLLNALFNLIHQQSSSTKNKILAKVDHRMKNIPSFTNLDTFGKSVFDIKLLSGKDYRTIMKFWMGVVNNLMPQPFNDPVVLAFKHYINFVMYARKKVISTSELADWNVEMKRYMAALNKCLLIHQTSHFKFEKHHLMTHYPEFTEQMGTADNYSTEMAESLHPIRIKDAWRNSNKHKGSEIQILKFNECMSLVDSMKTNFDDELEEKKKPKSFSRPKLSRPRHVKWKSPESMARESPYLRDLPYYIFDKINTNRDVLLSRVNSVEVAVMIEGQDDHLFMMARCTETWGHGTQNIRHDFVAVRNDVVDDVGVMLYDFFQIRGLFRCRYKECVDGETKLMEIDVAFGERWKICGRLPDQSGMFRFLRGSQLQRFEVFDVENIVRPVLMIPDWNDSQKSKKVTSVEQEWRSLYLANTVDDDAWNSSF